MLHSSLRQPAVQEGEDLGSTNGTYMNRTRVQQPTAIGPGDEVKMGKATLELRR